MSWVKGLLGALAKAIALIGSAWFFNGGTAAGDFSPERIRPIAAAPKL
jgi:hypothetical protein